MRKIVAVIVCFLLFLVYVLVSSHYGWNKGSGSAIYFAIFSAALIVVWSAITNKRDGK